MGTRRAVRRGQRGSILIQFLVGSVVSAIVMAALLQGTLSLWRMQAFGVGMPAVQDDARDIALRLADELRGADLCAATDSGCTLDAPVENANPTGVTVYERNDDGSLAERAYAVSGGAFTLTTDGKSTTLCTGATLTLTYYSGSSYYSNGLTAYTPTNATAKNLTAVGIVASVARNGLTGRFETFIRLRNSPKP